MNQLIIEYKTQDPIRSLVENALHKEERMLEMGIKHKAELLKRYEEKYNIPSKVFFEKMENGEMGDDFDFIGWAGEYEILQRLKLKLKNLMEIKICS